MPESLLSHSMSVVLLLIGVMLIVYFLRTILFDLSEILAITRFARDFKAMVTESPPSWTELKDLAPTWGLTQQQLHRIIMRLYRDAMAGRAKGLYLHKELMKGYISEYRRDEPFAELPSEIRIHMERLRDHTSSNGHVLELLTSQIKDILAISQKEIVIADAAPELPVPAESDGMP